MIISFSPSSSFPQLKRYLFFEIRLDWNPTSKMEKIQHAVCSLRHFRLSCVRPKKNPSNIERWFSNQSLTQTIARSAKKASVITKSMLSMRFTERKWIKMNLQDISKDLSKIFKHSNKRGSRELNPLIRKRRILKNLFNKEWKRLLLGNLNSELFQLLKFILNWKRTISFEQFFQ